MLNTRQRVPTVAGEVTSAPEVYTWTSKSVDVLNLGRVEPARHLMSAESKLLLDTGQLIRILSTSIPQSGQQCFLLSDFIVLRPAPPFRAKNYDKLRSRKFISNSGRAVRIKGSCRISGESDDQLVGATRLR
jgi:hypothetical protein